MRLFIPSIGTKLEVLSNWNFTLYEEWRNHKLCVSLGLVRDPFHYSPEPRSWTVTIPEGAQLTVQRMYIRSGASDFDSLTFGLNSHLTAAKALSLNMPKGRFWAKLHDVNSLDVRVIT